MLGRQETSSQIGKISESGIGVPLQVRSQMQVGVICFINDDVALVSLYSRLTIDQRRVSSMNQRRVSSMDQRRVSFSSMDSDQGEFDDFATPACNEAMNAAELQSEWKIDTPVWDEAPSTSSDQRGLASPEKHVDQRRVYSMDSDQGEFDDFATPACNEAMNAAELQSEWKIDNPVWDESPSTSSGYLGPASPERSQHFVCPTCSKSFAWKKSLVMHMKIHTGEKLFTCEICQISFGRNDSLKRHMKIHSKENDFKCDICDRSFQRKHCFAMHMQKHQEKKYDCKKCDRFFISLHHPNQHVRASHPEIKLTSVKRGTASTPEGNSKRVRREGGALNTLTSTFFQPTENSKKDFLLFFDEITPQLKEKIEEEIQEKGAVK
ncbi:PR domain zinc finger protein 4, partial [Araneus ventricosus]